MPAKIDPETGKMVNAGDTLYTYAQVALMRIPCPRCGTPVTISPRDVASNDTVGPQHFQVGRHTFNCRCYSPAIE